MGKSEIIHERILKWSKSNLRVFPWRITSDPYKILIAEIMLHRTQASQVEEVYKTFVEKYPDFKSICKTGKLKILSELSRLGLKWRAKFLYQLSCTLSQDYNGIIPFDKGKLLALSGVGPYISSAFLCFAYDSPEPILDTNTVRVIGRLFGLKITDSSRRSKKFEDLMKELVNLGNCRLFSLTLIDFADAICKSKNPLCNKCMLNTICDYYSDIIE
jgi:A/G-specific adenine glycosylase